MIKKIESLYFSDSFSALDAYSSEFDLFKAMGIRHREYVHSNILSVFLDPNYSHGMNNLFVNLFVRALNEVRVFSGSPLSLSTIISTTDTKVIVSRELDKIDLILEFPEVNLVIAIENKIWAEEQKDQIMRYQLKLATRYLSYKKALVFLTPNGYSPTTADKESLIPVYCMSYGNIIDICQLTVNKASQTAKFFLEQFIAHLERYMIGNDELSDLCWQIFQKHEEAYNFMVKQHINCIARKLKKHFDDISNKLMEENRFSEWSPDIEIGKKYNESKNNFELDIRYKKWPEGIYIKVYKHYWLGVFPFVNEVNKELVRKYFSKEPQSAWPPLYYFSANESLNKGRCVLENGDQISKTEINIILNRIYDFMLEIKGILQKDI